MFEVMLGIVGEALLALLEALVEVVMAALAWAGLRASGWRRLLVLAALGTGIVLACHFL